MMQKVQDLRLSRVPPGFRGRNAVLVQLWWIVQATLFRWSPQVLYRWRSFLLRLFGARIGKGVGIRPTAQVTYPWKLEIGDYCWIGDDCVIYNLGKITLGSNVALAHGVYLCTGLHDYTDPSFPIGASPITVADEVWLTNDVFVGPGVTIGRGCVVGARSTVLKDLPEMMLCAGYPAKVIRPRLEEKTARTNSCGPAHQASLRTPSG
jgi:putative colanic acid biosynthesis acetyltransferase WcaF